MKTSRSRGGPLLRALVLGSVAFVAGAHDAAASTDEILHKIVIVSRHGVRTPTAAPEILATWASQPWPD